MLKYLLYGQYPIYVQIISEKMNLGSKILYYLMFDKMEVLIVPLNYDNYLLGKIHRFIGVIRLKNINCL